jgi:hypothetical protein
MTTSFLPNGNKEVTFAEDQRYVPSIAVAGPPTTAIARLNSECAT